MNKIIDQVSVISFYFIFKNQLTQRLNFIITMQAFSNLFQSNFKDYSEASEEFSEYKLQFLHQHQPSFKQLGDVLQTKDDEGSSLNDLKELYINQNEENNDLFDLQVEIKLRRYTSFQNGFMENHRKILKNSLQGFLQKIPKIIRNSHPHSFQIQITDDIKSIVFNQNIFSHEQISQNRERFLKKIDQFKILREMFQNSQRIDKMVLKDAVLLGLWILKHTDHIVQDILHENSFCIQEVLKIKQGLLNYLQQNEKITHLKQKIAQKAQSETQFDVMIESWLYTLLIAKLGYFQNDCFDVEVSLEEHLKSLLKEEKRQHGRFSFDSEEEDITYLDLPMKKRKI